MDHYAGIDVSLEQSSVCVVDAAGRIVREAKVASEPEALVGFLHNLAPPLAHRPGGREARRRADGLCRDPAQVGRCLIATLLVNPLSDCPFSPPRRRRRIVVVSAVGPFGRRTMRPGTRPRHVERAVR